MGFLEAIVVIYMREQYYPEGFIFPLQILPPGIYFTELVRELSTIIMLLSLGLLLGKTAFDRFAWFLYAFGIWDIFYYVALKIFLGWPESLLTWDVLFLIPLVWLSPVIAPMLCSLTIIIFSLSVFYMKQDKSGAEYNKARKSFLAFFIAGAVLVFISFIYNYSELLINEGFFSKESPLLYDLGFNEAIISYVPGSFHWNLFIAGELLFIYGICRFMYYGLCKRQ